jgi:hypothetical protein
MAGSDVVLAYQGVVFTYDNCITKSSVHTYHFYEYYTRSGYHGRRLYKCPPNTEKANGLCVLHAAIVYNQNENPSVCRNYYGPMSADMTYFVLGDVSGWCSYSISYY